MSGRNTSATPFVLILNESLKCKENHFRVPHKSKVILQPEVHFDGVTVETNYPIISNERKFERTRYNTLKWKKNEDVNVWVVELSFDLPGSFHFVVKNLYHNENVYELYIVVDPPIRTLSCQKGCQIGWNSLNVQTVVSKCLGHVSDWSKVLEYSSDCGFNAIHFTPFQQFGQSRSSYSLKEHMLLDESLGGGKIDASLHNVVMELKEKFCCLLVDVVLNHMAADSPFLVQCPSAAYNLENSPHLKPAFLIDRALFYFNRKYIDYFKNGYLKGHQVTTELLDQMKNELVSEVLPALNIERFFTFNVNEYLEEIIKFKKNHPQLGFNPDTITKLKHEYCLKCSQEPNLESFFYPYVQDQTPFNENSFLHQIEYLRDALSEHNDKARHRVSEIYLDVAQNVVSHARYHFIDSNGPRWTEVTEKTPIIYQYFSINLPEYRPESLQMDENIFVLSPTSPSSDLASQYAMANQGWVFGDSTADFASESSEVYIRRHLVVWGDCVKLRYGRGESECPQLWNYVAQYVKSLAENFDGFRLDNCHSTPMHVLEYFIDVARSVNPNLAVLAELFTNSAEKDIEFVNKLGITCLVRERINAKNQNELCRLVHRFGSRYVGSFDQFSISSAVTPIPGILLKSTVPRPLFYDVTHDNEPLFKEFSIYEYLPTLGFVSFATCPIGTTRGFDELIRHQVSVVHESRQYCVYEKPSFAETEEAKTHQNSWIGMSEVRRRLNDLRVEMDHEGFDEIYIDQLADSVVSVTRANPQTGESYVMIMRFADKNPDTTKCAKSVSMDTSRNIQSSGEFQNFLIDHTSPTGHLPLVKINGIITEITLSSTMHEVKDFERNNNFPSSKVLDDRMGFFVFCNHHINSSPIVRFSQTGNESIDLSTTNVNLDRFPIGSLIILKCNLHPQSLHALNSLRNNFTFCPSKKIFRNPWIQCLDCLDLPDLNFLLFKCSEEEKDDGRFLYDLPNYGSFVYAGLYGVEAVLNIIRKNSDLGHPLCRNLRSGNWLMDYYLSRLEMNDKTKLLGHHLNNAFSHVKLLPRYLIPCYFDLVIRNLFHHIQENIFSRMSNFIKSGNSMVRQLTLSSISFSGNVPSCKPTPIEVFFQSCRKFKISPFSISAGLPHFATSWMRCWGRDILLSLRGNFLITGLYEEARYVILSVAGCVSPHGLIPNLMGNMGSFCRYNCRDAAWMFIQSVKDYCDFTNDFSILKDSVPLLRTGQTIDSLENIIQLILQSHWNGIDFVEENAGYNLDRCMSEKGFRVTAWIDRKTGLVYGGNERNCGTWMDKMGSSTQAANFSIPATPRDGAAIELSALCFSVVSWLDQIFQRELYSSPGVISGTNFDAHQVTVSWKSWREMIEKHFDHVFWVPEDLQSSQQKFDTQKNLINKLGIYKDIGHPSSQEFAQFQLRPNFLFAMKVAPELFSNVANVSSALEMARKYLEGCYGMRTLDPEDWAYRGDYNNGQDSRDYSTAQGFNYHQGPEWLWPVGSYLICKIRHLKKLSDPSKSETTKTEVYQMLHRLEGLLFQNTEQTLWLGLPELTQKYGERCADSCRNQSWSVAQIIEVYYELYCDSSKNTT